MTMYSAGKDGIPSVRLMEVSSGTTSKKEIGQHLTRTLKIFMFFSLVISLQELSQENNLKGKPRYSLQLFFILTEKEKQF